MNWDSWIGQWKQWSGRALREVGRRFGDRRLVVEGERVESGGRMQARYGLMKHQAQWGRLAPIRVARSAPESRRKR